MGACASSIKGKGGSDAKLWFSKFGAKDDRVIVLPESPLKDSKPADVDFRVKSFDHFGSEETFFDSKAWIDSDCEDDFFSVNGDFTPSRGNTPVHPKFSTGTPQVPNSPAAEGLSGYAAEPSPTGKKRLSELFRESIRENHDVYEPQAADSRDLPNGNGAAKQTILDVLPRSPQSAPYVSGANSIPGSERITNLDSRVERDVPMKPGQCCLPGLMPSRSLTERKRRMMSPAVTVGGKVRCLLTSEIV